MSDETDFEIELENEIKEEPKVEAKNRGRKAKSEEPSVVVADKVDEPLPAFLKKGVFFQDELEKWLAEAQGNLELYNKFVERNKQK